MSRSVVGLILLSGCLDLIDVGRHDAGAGASCVVGLDQTCNELPTMSSIAGACTPAGCVCSAGFELAPTGRCQAVPSCPSVSQQSGQPCSAAGLTCEYLAQPADCGGHTVRCDGSRWIEITRTQPQPSCNRDAGTGSGLRPPALEVEPAGELNLGRVAFVAGASAPATGRLTLKNASASAPRMTLKLGVGGAGPPYWTVTPKNAQSRLDEICVGRFDEALGACTGELPRSYDPAVGVVAGATLEIPIRVRPVNADVGPSGTKAWDVVIFSNDPATPEATITVSVRPLVLPPCVFSVTPTHLDFGLITPTASVRDLSFQICNLAPMSSPGDVCLVTDVELTTTSNPRFLLPQGPIVEEDLDPQECLTITTRAWSLAGFPLTPVVMTGAVSFTISAANGSPSAVSLTLVTSATACTFGEATSCNDVGVTGVAGTCSAAGACSCLPGHEFVGATQKCRSTAGATCVGAGPDQACNELQAIASFAGTCRWGRCSCSQGFEFSPSGRCQPIGAVCTDRIAQSCNDGALDAGVGAVAGSCVVGQCVCHSGFVLNATTGRCAGP